MTNETDVAKPFLRWAGGKQWFASHLDKYLPEGFNNYHEPFLGGGSVFIHLKSSGIIKGTAYLSDLNEDLINSYTAIRDDVRPLLRKLNNFENNEEFYYETRSKKYRSKITKAAQFIYLNRTSYNGIYRVNLKGEYNVPYGNKDYVELFEKENFKNLSKLFTDCIFQKRDFYDTLDVIQQGDLVFLDPPYTVAHEHNGFVKYNQKIFSWEDQIRLKSFIDELNNRKAHYILTNAAHKSIKALYKNVGKQFKVSRYSVIGGTNAKRDKYNEYVFCNEQQ